jgi:hypothetical protein
MLRWAGLMFLLSFAAYGQKQLVLLQRGNPVQHFTEGDYVHFIMKDGSRREGVIVELFEFSVITSNDTVQFNKVRKVGIPRDERRGLSKKFGFLLLAGGIVYLGVDLINSAAGYNTAGVDPQVVKASAILITAGSLLYFIRPKWRLVNQGTFLRTIDYKSPFYKTE